MKYFFARKVFLLIILSIFNSNATFASTVNNLSDTDLVIENELKESELKDIEFDGLIYSVDSEKRTAKVKGIKTDKSSLVDDLPSLFLQIPAINQSNTKSENNEEYKIISGDELLEWWKSNSEFSDKSKFIRISSSVSIDGISYPVESISNSCFEGCKDLSYVIIPESVKIIGSKAFYDCSSLRSVVFEGNSSLETIGISAFENSGIEFVSLPKSLSLIDKLAFANCENLKILNIESPMLTISIHAFNNCRNLSDVSIPCNFKKDNFNWSCLQLKNSNNTEFEITKASSSKFGLITQKTVGNGTIYSNHSFSPWSKVEGEQMKMRKCEFCNFVDIVSSSKFKGVINI